MISYVGQLLDREVVSLESSPLLNITLFFARILYGHLTDLFNQEEATRTKQWERLRANLARALHLLIRDIGRWLSYRRLEIENLAETSRQLMAHVNSIEGALSVAKSAGLTKRYELRSL
jgi:hypothetical protein